MTARAKPAAKKPRGRPEKAAYSTLRREKLGMVRRTIEVEEAVMVVIDAVAKREHRSINGQIREILAAFAESQK